MASRQTIVALVRLFLNRSRGGIGHAFPAPAHLQESKVTNRNVLHRRRLGVRSLFFIELPTDDSVYSPSDPSSHTGLQAASLAQTNLLSPRAMKVTAIERVLAILIIGVLGKRRRH